MASNEPIKGRIKPADTVANESLRSSDKAADRDIFRELNDEEVARISGSRSIRGLFL